VRICSPVLGLVMGVLLLGGCATQVRPEPTAQRSVSTRPTAPTPTPNALASTLPIARAGVPDQLRRSIDVGGRSLVLEPHVWRDYSLGDRPGASGAYFSGTVRSTAGSVPDSIRLLQFWIVLDADVWSGLPNDVRRWTHPQTGAVTFEAYARNGPLWPPNEVVRVVLRVEYQGQQFDLDADPVLIEAPS
jgi:hypothetical protein